MTQLTKDSISPNINHKPYISDNALEGWSIQNITWPFHRFNFSNPVLSPQKLFKIVTYTVSPLHARKCWLKPWMGEIIHFAPVMIRISNVQPPDWNSSLQSQKIAGLKNLTIRVYRNMLLVERKLLLTWQSGYRFLSLLTVHLSMSLDNDELNARLLSFTIRPLQSSTCFKH